MQIYQEVPGLVPEKGILDGYEVHVINYGSKHTKELIEALIVKNGGRRVQNCLKTTNIALADYLDFRCKLVNQKYGLPILKIEW